MSNDVHIQSCHICLSCPRQQCALRKKRRSLYLLSRERLATESFQARSPRYNGTSEGGRREDHGCGRQQLEEGGQLDMVRCGEENSPGRAPPACSRWRGREEGSGFRCP